MSVRSDLGKVELLVQSGFLGEILRFVCQNVVVESSVFEVKPLQVALVALSRSH